MSDQTPDELRARLTALPDFLRPLHTAAIRYADKPSAISRDGTLHIGHRPWVAEQNYLVILYPPIPTDTIDHYVQRLAIPIAVEYADFLRLIGGAFCFGMSLFGIPTSMRGGLRLIDRSVLDCHDIGTAARHWVHEYRVPAGVFHFGNRGYSPRAIIGYFYDAKGEIFSARTNGKIMGRWPDLASMLAEELPISEALEEKLHPSMW